MNLENKKVVITGGAAGFGRSLAKAFVNKGSKVFILDVNSENINKTKSELGIFGAKADVTLKDSLMTVFPKIISELGGIDIWINNAGVWSAPCPIENTDCDEAKRLFDINFFGTLNSIQEIVPYFKSQNFGTIVNIISTTAFDGMSGSSGSMYVASKYALRGLTNVVRDELLSNNIKVIGVYPGGMKTELFGDISPEHHEDFMSPDDIAVVVVGNLEKDEPETQLVLARPEQNLGPEIS